MENSSVAVFDVHITLESAMKDRTDAFLRCCLNLKDIKCREIYKTRADSWAEYVASVGLTMDKAKRMVRFAFITEDIHRQTGQFPILAAIDEDRLIRDWMPLVQYNKDTELIDNLDSALELLEQAKTLSYSDFQAVKDQHKQTKQHPEAQPVLSEGPVLDENKNVIGNYRTTKATGKQHFFTVGILDEYLNRNEGKEIKVSLGK